MIFRTGGKTLSSAVRVDANCFDAGGCQTAGVRRRLACSGFLDQHGPGRIQRMAIRLAGLVQLFDGSSPLVKRNPFCLQLPAIKGRAPAIEFRQAASLTVQG